MKTTAALIGLMLVVALLVTGLGTSLAEQVEHRGQTVDIGGDVRDCIVCHDGTLAAMSPFCTVKCNLGSPHSVLKDYPPRGKEDAYAPVSSLEGKGIRLFNGKITCVSCHDLNSAEKDLLVINNSDSRLCFSCHLK